MQKKQKILIFLLLILFLLIIYLIIISAPIKYDSNSDKVFFRIEQDNSVALENDYKLKAEEYFNAYKSLISNGSFTKENITELKNKLLGLKNVPKKFQNLHAQFVFSLIRMEDYLNQKDETKKSDSLQAISQLKADYSWLND